MQCIVAMSIPTEIHFEGREPNPSLEAYARGWVDRVSQATDCITSCTIRVENAPSTRRRGARYHVVLSLGVPGQALTVSREPGRDASHESAYLADRDAFVAVRDQLDDYVAHRATPTTT